MLALTRTEKKVLRMVRENLSSKEIALRLFITPKSVENYRSRICKNSALKMGITACYGGSSKTGT